VRKTDRILWVDPEFIKRLELIKARRLLRGKKNSMADITRDLINTKEFKEMERKLSELESESFLRYDG